LPSKKEKKEKKRKNKLFQGSTHLLKLKLGLEKYDSIKKIKPLFTP